jgi:N-acetylglutamate synthase
MNKRHRIRGMTLRDYDATYSLWLSTAGMGLNDLDDSRAGIEKYLKRNPKSCFVAVKAGKIVGAILSGHDGRRGFIYHTAVAESERNQGIGKDLVAAALASLQKEGIRKVAFVVMRENEIGNAFWENLGFEDRKDLIYRNKVITNEKMTRIEITEKKAVDPHG